MLPLRLVIDTNVLISAALKPGGFPRVESKDRTSAAKRGCGKSLCLDGVVPQWLKPHSFQSNYGRAKARPWSFYIFRSCELVGGRHFCHTRSTNRLSCASPGLLVRGSGFSNPRERSGIEIRALALVAGRPIPFPETPMTTQTVPVSRSSPL